MSRIKVMREQALVEIEVEEMRKGDIVAFGNGKIRTCTKEPIYDDDKDCFYVQFGNHLYHECYLGNMKEVVQEKESFISADDSLQGEPDDTLQGEPLENGNIKLWARVGMSFEVSNSEYERLKELGSKKDIASSSRLVEEWLQKGYGYTDGDSYFTDGEDHEIYFDMSYMPVVAGSQEKEKGAEWTEDMLKEVEQLNKNTPDGQIMDADTILVDLLQDCDHEFTGFAQDIFNIWKNSTDKKAVEQMFYEFTDMEFDRYLMKCKEEISQPVQDGTSLDEKMMRAMKHTDSNKEKSVRKEINIGK